MAPTPIRQMTELPPTDAVDLSDMARRMGILLRLLPDADGHVTVTWAENGISRTLSLSTYTGDPDDEDSGPQAGGTDD